MLSDAMRVGIEMALLPVVYYFIRRFAAGPATRFLFRHFTYRIASFLTKTILGNR